MSDIVKWGLLVGSIVTILALLTTIFQVVSLVEVTGATGRAINEAVRILTPYFQAARGFLNTVCGTYVVYDVLLYIGIFKVFVFLSAKPLLAIYRWIFK